MFLKRIMIKFNKKIYTLQKAQNYKLVLKWGNLI